MQAKSNFKADELFVTIKAVPSSLYKEAKYISSKKFKMAAVKAQRTSSARDCRARNDKNHENKITKDILYFLDVQCVAGELVHHG